MLTDAVREEPFTGQGQGHFLKYTLNYTYLLSNFFFHLYWGAQLRDLFDTFASISSVLPKDVVLRVRTPNDCRPVVGASLWAGKKGKTKKKQPSRQPQSSIPDFSLQCQVWSARSSPVPRPCTWRMLPVLSTSNRICRVVRTSQWTTETQHQVLDVITQAEMVRNTAFQLIKQQHPPPCPPNRLPIQAGLAQFFFTEDFTSGSSTTLSF